MPSRVARPTDHRARAKTDRGTGRSATGTWQGRRRQHAGQPHVARNLTVVLGQIGDEGDEKSRAHELVVGILKMLGDGPTVCCGGIGL